VITGTLGNDGWYTSDVTITFTVSDPESPFTTTCTDQTFTADTADVAVNCSATSAGGLTLFQAHFKIDQTAPVLAPTVVPNPVLIGGAAVADPHASDAMSGISSSSCAAPATATAGVKSLVCTAEDNAGNTSSASVGYTVAYRFLGFQRPTTGAVVKAGATVTIAFAVGTSSGDRLTDLQASALAAGCQVRVSFTGGNPNPDCATYNPTNDTFGFTLKTQKGLSGNQTITVQVFVGTDVVTTGSVVVKVKP
jgi:hypothetical protein